MGYHVTILRTKDSVLVPISLEEVHEATASLGGWQYTEDDKAFLKKNGDEVSCVLWYDSGTLWTKTPSQWALEQMIALAVPLHARVRGDEFETYETLEKWYSHPDDAKLRTEAKITSDASLKASRKQQRWIHLIIVGFFVLLGVIGYVIGKSFEK